MNKDIENTYECEDCEGTFIIKPDIDEQIKYCPQCGNDICFKNIFNPIEYGENFNAYD